MSGNFARSGKSPKVRERSENLGSQGNFIVAAQLNNLTCTLFVL